MIIRVIIIIEITTAVVISYRSHIVRGFLCLKLSLNCPCPQHKIIHWEWRYSSTHSLDGSACSVATSRQFHTRGHTPMNRRSVGPQSLPGRSEIDKHFSAPSRIEPRLLDQAACSDAATSDRTVRLFSTVICSRFGYIKLQLAI